MDQNLLTRYGGILSNSSSKERNLNYCQLYQENKIISLIKFILEICKKLEVRYSTTTSATHLLLKSNKNIRAGSLDRIASFSVASACVLLASKGNEDQVRMKDLVNVSIITLNRDLMDDIADESLQNAMRQSIIKSELLILRALYFDTAIDYPHNYLLCYLKIIESWLGNKLKNCPNVTEIAISCLQDFYFTPSIIEYQPQKVALAVIILTYQIIGLQVFEDEKLWYSSFCETTEEEIWEIIDESVKVHDFEL